MTEQMADLIAERILKIVDGEQVTPVPVRIYAPRHDTTLFGEHWLCDFEIVWPDEPRRFYAAGEDAVQALELVLKMIGIHLYTSDAHERGQLMWTEPGRGYGFPVTANVRDTLVGDDARYL